MTGFRALEAEAASLAGPGLMAERGCPVCGAAAARTVLRFDDYLFFSDAPGKRAPITQVQCRRCLALYMNPCFTQGGFALLFAEAGQSYGSLASSIQQAAAWLAVRGLAQPGRTVLDIGCYQGAFLRALPDGVPGIGVDIDGPAIARANAAARPGHRFIHADFDRFTVSEAVATITLFHVLEHLPDPLGTLRHLRRLARPDTRLVVEVPVLETGATNNVCGLLTVQHLTHFSRRSLANVLARAGWDILEAEDMSGYSGYRIVARPGEAAATITPDPEDAARLDDYLAVWHGEMAKLNRRVLALSGRRCVIWGGGMHLEYLYHLTPLFADAERRWLVVDRDPLKQGKTWRGVAIADPDAVLPGLDWRDTALLVSSYGHQPAIAQAARELGAPPQAIVTLYDRIDRY